MSQAGPILRKIAAAIDFSHDNGFIHGDIKPENVLVGSADNSDDLFLADFGMATYFPLTEDMDDTTWSRTVEQKGGTTAYMSPEQLDRLELSPLSDIYSFSLVAYELLTGRLPIDPNLPPFRRMKAKVEGDISDPRSANPFLSEKAAKAILQGLSVQPGERPRRARLICELIFPFDQNLRDFFISYNSNDRKWAEWIAWELELVGFSTVLQEWDFRPGSNFVVEMNDASTRAS